MTNTPETTIDQILSLYREFLKAPSFESYESRENEIGALFDELKQQDLGNVDHLKILELKQLHDHVISIILLEKESLGETISVFNKKKRAKYQYGKVSNYESGMDAFFLDYKK